MSFSQSSSPTLMKEQYQKKENEKQRIIEKVGSEHVQPTKEEQDYATDVIKIISEQFSEDLITKNLDDLDAPIRRAIAAECEKLQVTFEVQKRIEKTVGMMVLGNGAYFFGPQLLHIYTSSDAVIKCGMEILLYTTVTYFLCGFMDLFPGALRGMGHSGVPMLLSIIGTVGTRIVWIYWIFPRHRSLAVLFISYPASWIITLAMQIICYFYVRKMLYKKIANKK